VCYKLLAFQASPRPYQEQGLASFRPASTLSTSTLQSLEAIIQPSTPPQFSSHELEVGAIYTRNQLTGQFTITDSNVKNGVFRLQSSNSLWLFVTE
jgi:hypothetical protein